MKILGDFPPVAKHKALFQRRFKSGQASAADEGRVGFEAPRDHNQVGFGVNTQVKPDRPAEDAFAGFSELFEDRPRISGDLPLNSHPLGRDFADFKSYHTGKSKTFEKQKQVIVTKTGDSG